MSLTPLLTDHQWERFSRLRYGVLTNFNRAENYPDYIKFLVMIRLLLCKDTKRTNMKDGFLNIPLRVLII